MLWTNNAFVNSLSNDGVNKKIYLVMEGKTVKDGGFNQSCWHALEHFNLQAQVQALAGLSLTPAALERGLHALARAIDEADTAARYGARVVARDGWLQLRPTPAARERS